jgi:hypothetical protein
LTHHKENPIHIVKDKYGMNRIKPLHPVLIEFYKNVIVIKGHPFQLYSSKEGKQILADILKGYFPN